MPSTSLVNLEIFVGDSEMAALMRSKDWSATPLGPPESWPEALKVALRILLTSRFEMWLGWGPDIVVFYNDAYRPTLGIKHPDALGKPMKRLWSEVWDDVEDRVRAVYERGEATWDRGLLLLLERNGYPEETYHTFSYSPVLDDDGRVGGPFCAVSEETNRVISERRLASLRTLAEGLGLADSSRRRHRRRTDSFGYPWIRARRSGRRKLCRTVMSHATPRGRTQIRRPATALWP